MTVWKKKAGVDPVESAKIGPAAPPVVIVPPPVAVVTPVPKPAVAPIPAAAVVPGKIVGWKVLKNKKVSLSGQITLLPAGTVVTEASYGAGIYAKLKEQGVEMLAVSQ